MTFDHSPVLEAFLAAEIRNEDGIQPVTLASALHSLEQMPDDILADLNPAIRRMGASHDGLRREFETLIERHGAAYEVEGAVDATAGR